MRRSISRGGIAAATMFLLIASFTAYGERAYQLGIAYATLSIACTLNKKFLP